MSSQSKRIYVRTRKRTMFLVCALFVIPWIILAVVYFGGRSASSSERDLAVPAYHCKQGPWGELEAYDFVTTPPADFLTDKLFPPADAEWRFGDISRDALNAKLEAAGLSADRHAQLLKGVEFSPDQGWVLRPSDELILSLTPSVRKNVYAELAKLAENRRQVDPFIFDPAILDRWLAGAGLKPVTLATVKKLLYPHGDRVLLADTVTLMKTIPEQEERKKLLGVLLRRATVMLKLRVEENADVRPLASYWGMNGRKSPLTILEGLRQNRGGMQVETLVLMPPFVRANLYRYPAQSDSAVAQHRDCHWSAFNFFNEVADDRFVDPEKIKETLNADYRLVEGAPQLGDIGMLSTPDNRTVLSSVFIADDIYFTKNGPSHISPWVLMKIKDIQALFPAYEQLEIKHYRLKKNFAVSLRASEL